MNWMVGSPFAQAGDRVCLTRRETVPRRHSHKQDERILKGSTLPVQEPTNHVEIALIWIRYIGVPVLGGVRRMRSSWHILHARALAVPAVRRRLSEQARTAAGADGSSTLTEEVEPSAPVWPPRASTSSCFTPAASIAASVRRAD